MEIDLYCLPYSGASAIVYSQWQQKLPSWLQIRLLELPGRGMRMNEPLQTDIREVVDQLAAKIPHIGRNRPYAVFGHSLGAILAFELTHQLINRGDPPPVSLFVSGTSAPTRRQRCIEELAQLKTDEALRDHLKKLGGTSEEVMASEELMSLILPIIRADFQLCENYRYSEYPKLPCHLVVMSGRADDISGEELLGWQNEAGKKFSMMMFDGGHFFIHESQADILLFIRKHLKEYIASYRSYGDLHSPFYQAHSIAE